MVEIIKALSQNPLTGTSAAVAVIAFICGLVLYFLKWKSEKDEKKHTLNLYSEMVTSLGNINGNVALCYEQEKATHAKLNDIVNNHKKIVDEVDEKGDQLRDTILKDLRTYEEKNYNQNKDVHQRIGGMSEKLAQIKPPDPIDKEYLKQTLRDVYKEVEKRR